MGYTFAFLAHFDKKEKHILKGKQTHHCRSIIIRREFSSVSAVSYRETSQWALNRKWRRCDLNKWWNVKKR
jgi:hypothetical protein